VLIALAMVVGLASVAAEPVDEIEFVPVGGTVLEIAGVGAYAGTVRITQVGSVVSVTERVSLDEYLLGLREVPFSWPEAALEAQAIAARTYLARTMAGGRTSTGRRYGFDICATTQCQVYRGVPAGADIDRWQAAIEATSGFLVLDDGRPALTLYFSSAGSRTRANQDIFGSEPLPYLQPVDSPEAGVTPHETWTVDVPTSVLVTILGAEGFSVDRIVDIALDRPAEGAGPATVIVTTNEGVIRLASTGLRAILNRWGPQLYPGLFPGRRSDRTRLSQTLPSTSFDLTFSTGSGPPPTLARLLPAFDQGSAGAVRLVGEGWGHGVGMSQWGANAMAQVGADVAEILSHYYTGLHPTDAADLVPDEVLVGLSWDRAAVLVEASGPFDMLVNGVAFGGSGGAWEVRATAGGLALLPPEEQAALGSAIAGRWWPR
jgi:stage II sporulation protein D